MEVGECQISDASRGVAYRSELRQQRPIHRICIELLGRNAILEGAVGDFAGVPHHGSARMDDEEAGRDHLRTGHFAWLEAVVLDRGRGDPATIENVET